MLRQAIVLSLAGAGCTVAVALSRRIFVRYHDGDLIAKLRTTLAPAIAQARPRRVLKSCHRRCAAQPRRGAMQKGASVSLRSRGAAGSSSARQKTPLRAGLANQPEAKPEVEEGIRSAMLRLDDVAIRYGDGPEVLNALNLTLQRGEFVYLMGPTGAGKSSLLRLLGLLQRPSRGELNLFGQDVASLSHAERTALRRRIGMVFQDRRLLDHLSAYDNVALPLRINGAREDQVEGFVPELLTWFGLGAVADAKPPNLSVGQRQLIAVARAVVIRPGLLLCDEPTSNLDSSRAGRVIHLFTQLCKLGTTVVLATHSEGLVKRYRHPVLRLIDGHIQGRLPFPQTTATTGATGRPTDELALCQPPASPDRAECARMKTAPVKAEDDGYPKRRRRKRTTKPQFRRRPRRKRGPGRGAGVGGRRTSS
jgi:cell division transport system ATP-binding protein